MHSQNCQQYLTSSSRYLHSNISVAWFQWKYLFWCNSRIVFLFLSPIFYDFAQENFSDRFVFYLLRYFQKTNRQSLTCILKNVNSMYCYVIKYLRNILPCIIFILTQVWNPPNISWLIFQSSAQLCFSSTDFYRALPFGEKSIFCLFPKPSCIRVTNPSKKELEAQNASSLEHLPNIGKIWNWRAVPFSLSFGNKTCSLVRSPYHWSLNICCD